MSKSTAFYALVSITALSLVGLICFVAFETPTAQMAAGGLAQKIFYIHVPSAYAMYLCGAVCFAGSVAHLSGESDSRNSVAQSGAECAVVFGLLMLTTGPLWAKKAWGVYWTWDPRLTTTLLSVLVYASIVVFRSFVGDGAAERRAAAAIGVLGTVNLPIIHYAVRLWGGNHPTVITNTGGGLKDPAMTQALFIGFFYFTLLAILLLWLRTRAVSLATQASLLEERAIAEELLED
ncbi:MAG: cytochrome c biogenesis protein CcsA [Polyangiaceae bacterium]|nr:cytochrome c biogenesis protein CcsA [Polyangiaceae bacterium]